MVSVILFKSFVFTESKLSKVNLKSILSQSLIVQNENYDTRIFLNALCQKNNIQLKPTLEVDRHGLIIEFVKAVKSAKKEKEIVSVINGKEYKIKAAGYLLGQIVRQYNIPEDHYYISVAAENKWKELSNENIWDFVYRDSITCTSEVPVSVKKYKNQEKQ